MTHSINDITSNTGHPPIDNNNRTGFGRNPKNRKSKHFTKNTYYISRRRPTGFQPGTLQQTAAHQQTAIPFNDQ